MSMPYGSSMWEVTARTSSRVDVLISFTRPGSPPLWYRLVPDPDMAEPQARPISRCVFGEVVPEIVPWYVPDVDV